MIDTFTITDCGPSHLDAIAAILNSAIVETTAVYEYHPRTTEQMQRWFETKQEQRHPILGAIDGAGALLGYATFGPFRAFPAFKYTAEHSVYVAASARGRGVGKALLDRVIQHAKDSAYHVLIGVIDRHNAASIRLHENAGYRCAGTLPEVGYKFDRWQDVNIYQLTLDSSTQPVDAPSIQTKTEA